MGQYGSGDVSWFNHDRFGMFIHWGLYSMIAKHEWIRVYEKNAVTGISDEDYKIYFDLFDPDLFDPKAWAKAAREAGMKYFVITTKHHEGFCMWDSKYTDYKVTNTPCGKDLLKEVVEAFRAEGLKIGLYYSLIDWHHPDFPVDRYHPLSIINPDGIEEMNKTRDMKKYAEYMRNQVTELLTQYGKIDVLWFDFSYKTITDEKGNVKLGKGHEDWESEKMIKLVRELQPEIVVNNRLDLPGSGDTQTPEQYTPLYDKVDENGEHVVWEGCHTFSGAWGYSRDEQTWKSPKQCIDLLINHVSRNGNLLMNVGPTSRGCIDKRAMNCLAAFGEWMKYHARSIYGCGMAPEEFVEPRDCRYTYNPEKKRLYLHFMNWPFRDVFLPGLDGKLLYAQLLNDGSEVKWRGANSEAGNNMLESTEQNGVWLTLPVNKPDVEVPVVEFFLK